jgi:TPR repeat protein
MKTIFIVLTLCFSACSGLNKYERRARRGDVDACNMLVHLLDETRYVNGTDKKLDDKIYHYASLCLRLDTGNWYAGYHYMQVADYYKTSKPEAYRYYYKAAQYGDEKGQLITAISYYDGKYRAVNKDSALYWYEQAQHSGAKYYIGRQAYESAADMLYEGKDVKADTVKALYYYKKACTCCEGTSSISACDKVIRHYRKLNLKDTSDIMIYKDQAEYMRQRSSNYK